MQINRHRMPKPHGASKTEPQGALPRIHLDHAVSTTANHPFSVLAPYHGADTLAAHRPVAGHLLRA